MSSGGSADARITNRLAEHRIAHGMTQWELAEACGISREAISNAERGLSAPTLPAALRLAAVLGVRVEDLFQLASSEATVARSPASERQRRQSVTTTDRLDRIELMLARLLKQSEEE